MKFVSTNGGFEVSSFSEAILTGLCPDGGLLMPEHLPKLSIAQLESWKNLSYPFLLAEFLKYIVDQNDPVYEHISDISKETFKKFCKNTVEIKKLKSCFVVELFHGPTKAFKDYPLFPLAYLIDKAIKVKAKDNNGVLKKQNLIIVTSGDTGSSALEASRFYTETLRVFVLFPNDRVTPTQRLQITTANSDNGFAIECSGTCDELEDIVRAINDDKEYSKLFNISCLNSINCGRIICQMALHIFIYLQLTEKVGDSLVSAIPCGGWGNLLGACLVNQMGLPIKLILCTNENDLGDKLIKTGMVERDDTSHFSWSSAMDTTLPYNMARLFWMFSDQDTNFTKSTMSRIEQGEKVTIPSKIMEKIVFHIINLLNYEISKFNTDIRSVIIDSFAASCDETLKTMATCFHEEQYSICPHTATALAYFYHNKDIANTCAVLGTASISKFSEAGIEAGVIDKCENSFFLTQLQKKQECYTVIDKNEDPIKFLKDFIALHN